MPGLIGRVRGLLSRRASESGPSPFNVRCLCGETIQGARRQEYQLLTCPSCASPVFIFPRSPLPVPAAPSKRKAKAAKAQKASASAKSLAKPPASAPTIPTEPAIPLSERLGRIGRRLLAVLAVFVPPRHWFSVPRLVFAGVIVLMIATAVWQIRTTTIRNLRALVIPEAQRGLKALRQGDLDEARAHLERSVTAIDRLDEPFADEASYRQALAELAILHDLIDEPLESLLLGGTRNPQSKSQSLYDQAILLDSEVRPMAEGGWSVDYVAFADDTPVQIVASDLQLFDRMGITQPTRVIFGARLDRLERSQQGQWQLRLQPQSGVLISERAIFDTLGITDDETSSVTRRRQRQLIVEWTGPPGISPGE